MADPAALPDLILLATTGVVLSCAMFVVWRPRVPPGVCIGLMALVALVATVIVEPAPWLRFILVAIGAVFLGGEVFAIRWDRERWAAEAREEREAAEARFTATMDRHDSAALELSETRRETARSFEQTHSAFEQTSIVLSGLQSRVALDTRHGLLRRLRHWYEGLDDLLRPYLRNQHTLEHRAAKLKSYPDPDGERADAERARVGVLYQKLTEERMELLAAFAFNHASGILQVLNECSDHYSFEATSRALEIMHDHIEDVDKIRILWLELGEIIGALSTA